MANLLELIRDLSEHQKQYLIRRIAGINAQVSRELTGITKGTYNTWFHNEKFATLHRQLSDLEYEHKNEAIQILRRNNQLEAVLLESKIIAKMKEEIESGELNLCRTNLAREVYSKLISDLDAVPQVKVMSWQQRVQQIFQRAPEQGEIIDGKFEAVSEQENQYQESLLISSGKQRPDDPSEEAES